jgi:DNA-binding HxlR family transcriptional regulator
MGAGIDSLELAVELADGGPRPRTHRSWTPLARALAAAGDDWTLMIVLRLADGRMRLSHLQRCLPGVSTGVLERYVQQMDALGLLTRTRFREMPPRVEVELTDAGGELIPVAGALARWGMRRLWSPPRERERVDVGALLCLLPVLLEEETALPEGSLEAISTHVEPPVRHVYETVSGRLCPAEGADGNATARVRGDGDAWIAALGPDGDYRRLRFSGDRRLARGILDSLPRRARAV